MATHKQREAWLDEVDYIIGQIGVDPEDQTGRIDESDPEATVATWRAPIGRKHYTVRVDVIVSEAGAWTAVDGAHVGTFKSADAAVAAIQRKLARFARGRPR